MELEEAVERIKFETHRFARHQANWFREDAPEISWFTMEEWRRNGRSELR